MTQKYTHSKLGSEDGSIRLLTILHRTKDTIECTCEVTDKPPSYCALSYTWGSSPKTKSILINGQLFDVRWTLWNFLDLASRRQPGLVVWIDAICIDQGNHSEKTRQVLRMGHIYSKAKRVYIWLNKDLKLHELLELAKQDSYDTRSRRERLQQDIWTELITHEYWTRLWIIQETLLAAQLYIFCAEGDLSLNSLQYHRFAIPVSKLKGAGMNLVMEARLGLLLASAGLQNGQPANSLLPHMANFWKDSSWNILKLKWDQIKPIDFEQVNQQLKKAIFNLSEQAECYDVRDRVFGLLSFIPGGENFPGRYGDTEVEFLFKTIAFFGFSTFDIRFLERSLKVSRDQMEEWLDSASVDGTTLIKLSKVPLGQAPNGRKAAVIQFESVVVLIWFDKTTAYNSRNIVYRSRSWDVHEKPSNLHTPTKHFGYNEWTIVAVRNVISTTLSGLCWLDVVLPKCLFARMCVLGHFGSRSPLTRRIMMKGTQPAASLADMKRLLGHL